MAVQAGLCRTWSETPKTGFLRTRLILSATFFNMFKGYNVGCLRGQFFRIFEEKKLFCFVVAICDLVHDVEAIFPLP